MESTKKPGPRTPLRRGRPVAARIRSRVGARVILLVALVGMTQGCVWEPVKLEKGPERAVPPTVEIDPLPLDAALPGTLDCPAGDCEARFRVDVPEEGLLGLVLTPEGTPEWIRMTLKSPMQEVMARTQTEEGGAISLRQSVRRGPHYVLVQSIGGRTDFQIEARMQGGAAPAPAAAPPGRGILDRCLEEAPTFCVGVEDEADCTDRHRDGCWRRFGGSDRARPDAAPQAE